MRRYKESPNVSLGLSYYGFMGFMYYCCFVFFLLLDLFMHIV